MRRRSLFLGALLCAAAAGVWVLTAPFQTRDAIAPAPFEALPDSVSIVAMGTSLTARYDWPDALGERLGACLARPVAVAKVAKSGETVRWGRGRIAQVVAARPDIVLVEFIANDADLRHRLSPAESRALHGEIIAGIHAALPQARVVLVGTGPVFGLRGWARPRRGAYLDGYGALAQGAPHVGLLDTGAQWQNYIAARARSAVMPDGLHPDPAAARAVMRAALAPPLAALWGRPCPETAA